MEETVVLNGKEITKEQLEETKTQVANTKDIKVVQIQEKVFKTRLES